MFITPNLYDDMHDSCSPTRNRIKQGDNWLKTVVPLLRSLEEIYGVPLLNDATGETDLEDLFQ